MPTVSILVPCFNVEDTLAETLDSLIKQYYQDFEVILINDGSTDATASIIQSYLRKDQRFVSFFQENRGISSALNAGLAVSQGEFIARIDADDVADPSWLSDMLQYLKENSELSAASCNYTTFGNKVPFSSTHPSDSAILNVLLCYCSPISHPGFVCRKRAMQRYKLDIAAEDHCLWCDMFERNHLIGNCPRSLIKYRVSTTSLSARRRKEIKTSVIRRGFEHFMQQRAIIASIPFSDIIMAARKSNGVRYTPSLLLVLIARLILLGR